MGEEGLDGARCGLELRKRGPEHQGSDDAVGGGVAVTIWSGTVAEMNAVMLKVIIPTLQTHCLCIITI